MGGAGWIVWPLMLISGPGDGRGDAESIPSSTIFPFLFAFFVVVGRVGMGTGVDARELTEDVVVGEMVWENGDGWRRVDGRRCWVGWVGWLV